MPAHLPPEGAIRERNLLNTTDTAYGYAVINVTRADTGAFVGYVGSNNGERPYRGQPELFGIATTDPYLFASTAIKVSVPAGSNVSVFIDYGPHPDVYTNFPYLGFAIDSNDGSEPTPSTDLSTDTSPNGPVYALLQATTFSAAKARPSTQVPTSFDHGQAAESSVWSSQAGSDVLTPVWTNSDGSAAPTVLIYNADSDTFAIIGSLDQARVFGVQQYAVIFTAWPLAHVTVDPYL